MPNAYDKKINSDVIYLSSTKVRDMKTAEESDSDGTVNGSSGSSYGKLDDNWWEVGYHPYAFVKDKDISDIEGFEGCTMTLTQISRYYQGLQGEPTGFRGITYPKSNNGWGICGMTSTGNLFSAWDNKAWTISDMYAYCKEVRFESNGGLYTGDYGHKYIQNHYSGQLEDKNMQGTKNMTVDQLVEVFDKGGVVVFSVLASSGVSQITGHIEIAHGYIKQDGKVKYFLVSDPNLGSTVLSWIKAYKTSKWIHNTVIATSADTFISKDVKWICNVITPVNIPTSSDDSSDSDSSSSSGGLKSTKVLNQHSSGSKDYKSGCEMTSAAMALYYYGFSPNLDTIMSSSILPQSGISGLDSSNPYEKFWGDPTDKYGCFPPVVVKAINNYLDTQGKKSEYSVTDITGTSLKDVVKNYTDKNIPVLVWGDISPESPSRSTGKAYTYNGKSVSWISSEHCMLVVGYDDTHIIVNDPDKGAQKTYTWSKFQEGYDARGKMAVALKKN
jgi:uncharacterized protein YvpB